MLNEQPGHRGIVSAVTVTEGGRAALTSSGDRTIRKWDLANGREVGRTMIDQPVVAHGVTAFAPDGRTALAKWPQDGAPVVGLVDTTTGKLIARLPVDRAGSSYRSSPPAWLPDGSVIVLDETNKASHFDRAGRKLRTFTAAAGWQVSTLALSPDGRSLVLAGVDLPDAGLGRPGLHTGRGWIGLFDVRSGESRGLWEFPNQFVSATYTPDGKAVVLSGSVSPLRSGNEPPVAVDRATAVVLFDPARGKVYMPFAAPDLQGPQRRATALAMAPTGYQLAVAEVFQNDYSITVYETASGAIRRQLHGHRNAIEQLAFTPDGLRLVSASRDGTALVWDVAPPVPAASVALSEANQHKRWDSLSASNGEEAYRVMGELIAERTATVAFLKANLQPTPAPTDAEVDRLIDRLDAAGFADRAALPGRSTTMASPLCRGCAPAWRWFPHRKSADGWRHFCRSTKNADGSRAIACASAAR